MDCSRSSLRKLVATVMWFLATGVLLAATPALAADWYASPAGDDTNDCASVATPCKTIQAAINKAATAGDTLSVIAGTYVENVVVNKTVTIKGPKAGIAGYDTARDGSGEAVIKPATGVGISISANEAIVDGLTVQANGGSGLQSGGRNGVKVLNTRFVNSANRGIYVDGPQSPTGWLIEGNLFDTLTGTSSTAITMVNTKDLAILDNVIRNVTYQGVQLSNAQTAEIRGNNISNTQFDGINVANGNGVVIAGNTIASVNQQNGADRGAVRLYAGMTGVSVVCNDIDATNGGIALRAGTSSGLTVFHNAVVGGTSVVSYWTDGADIGSNWYGGNAATVGGDNATELHIADALPANPIGDADCGDNSAVSLVAYAGTADQSTKVDTAFDPLRARVQDILGGAVVGQPITLVANTVAGATAVLGTPSGNGNYNGELISTATANSVVGGPYTVDAESPGFTTAFTLRNIIGDATITLDAGSLSAVYDTTAHAVTAQTIPAGLSYSVTYDGVATEPTDVGTYAVVASVTDSNYSGTASGTLTITEAAGTVEWLTTIFIYDGSTHTPTARIEQEPASACVVSGTVGPDVGNYPVTATCTGNNYTASGGTTAEVTQATATIAFSHLVQQEDGSPKSVVVTTTPAGLPVTVTYDGSTTPPSAVGSYVVVATVVDTNYMGSANATLQIVQNTSDIALQLNGPIAGIHVGQPAQYVGILRADPLPDPSRLFFVEVRLSKSTGVMQESDLAKMELYNGGTWEDATGQLPFNQDGNDLVYLFPKPAMDDGFPIDAAEWSWQFRFTYADAATYTATARVVDAADMSQVSAPVTIWTEVMPPSTDVSLQLNGPVAGVEVDVPVAYIGRLVNAGPALSEKVFVKVRVELDGGTLAAGDVSADVWDGGAWVPGIFTVVAGGLEVDFPDSAGFDLPSPFDYTHQFRITYHVPGLFSASAQVVGVDFPNNVYATSSMYTQVVPQSADVSLQVNGPVAGVEVDVPAAYIGRLTNHGPALTENAFVKVHITHDGGPLVATDVTTEVLSGTSWIEGVLIPDGNGGLEVDFPDSNGFPIDAGFDYTHHFRITYHKPGVFNATATLVGVNSSDIYAMSAMYTEVVPRSAVTASVLIDPASLHVTYDGQPHAAAVSSTPVVQDITVTYDGSSTTPIDAGSYVVVATVVDPVYVGSASAILVIDQAVGSVMFGATNFGFDGLPHATTAVIAQEPADVAACTLTGSSGAYPRTDAGSSTVNAACVGSNYTANGSSTVVVSPKTVTITLAGTGSFPYDGNPHAATATVTGEVSGFPVSAQVQYNPGGSSAPVAVGSYGVTASIAAGGNYTAVDVYGTIIIASASATVSLGNLSQTYDGTPREVTVTTTPTGLATQVTYDDSSTAPTNAGTYTVVATITEPGYSGSASGTLVVDKQAATVTLSDTTQVYDGSPKPVTVVTAPAGLDADVTYDGSSAPPSAIGNYAVVATVTDVNYTGSASGILAIVAADAPDLSVSMSNGRNFVQYGKLLTYVITVNNVGNVPVSGASVIDVLPPELEQASWTCMALGTATCTASGNGDINDTVDVPVGGGLLYMLTARVVDAPVSDRIINQVTVSATGDVNPANDTATDTTDAVLFRDGFEMGGDGAQPIDSEQPVIEMTTLAGEATLSLNLAHAWHGDIVLTTIAHGSATGGATFRVEGIHVNGMWHVRLVADDGHGERASAWSTIADGGSQLALGLATAGGTTRVMLAGADQDLELTVPTTTFRVMLGAGNR